MILILEYKCVKNIKLGYIFDFVLIIDLNKMVVFLGFFKCVLIVLYGYVLKEIDYKML